MERDDEGVKLTAAYRVQMVASFLEIAVGQTHDTARQFLHAANWNLEQAIHLFYSGKEYESSCTLPPDNDVSDQNSDNSDEKSKGSGFWGADQGSTSGAETSKDNLAYLYRPPFALMYHGSFEEAKETANGKDRWLIVNVQSTREFSSHMLNRDTWANEAVVETITNNFVFWQVGDDTEEGSKISTYYKLDSYPVTLVIDPITGQKMRFWRGMVQPDCLLEDLLQFMDASPKDHHFSLSHNHSREIPHTSPSKIQDETNEDDEELKLAQALSRGTINDNDEVSLKGSDAVKEASEKEKCTYPPLPEEPQDDRIRVRLPDGQRLQRNFLRSDPIQDVKNINAKGKRNGKKDKRNTHSGQTSSNNGDVHTLTMMAPELLPSYLKNIAEFVNENKGESLSSSSAIALIKKKSEMMLHQVEACIEDFKLRAKECRLKHVNLKLCEVLRCDVKMSVKEEYLQLILKKLLENGLIELDPTTHKSKGGQIAVSGSSSTTEVKETQK